MNYILKTFTSVLGIWLMYHKCCFYPQNMSKHNDADEVIEHGSSAFLVQKTTLCGVLKIIFYFLKLMKYNPYFIK